VGEGVGNNILSVRYVEGRPLNPEASRSAVPSFAKEAKLGQPQLWRYRQSWASPRVHVASTIGHESHVPELNVTRFPIALSLASNRFSGVRPSVSLLTTLQITANMGSPPYRKAIVAFFLLVLTLNTTLVVAVHAQEALTQPRSPKEVLEQFCRMDAEGKQLSPEAGTQVTGLLDFQKPWAQHPEIIVVKDYVVRGPDMQNDTARFVVDYHVWGRLDSSLRFERLEGLVVNHPIRVREYIPLVRTDKHIEVGNDGQWRQVKGALEWRIGTIPSAPHVSVDTAIRYLTEFRDKSSDPIVKTNADRAVHDLRVLLRAPSAQPTGNLQQSPKAALLEFCTAETKGKGLTRDGWKQLTAFFVRPLPWQQDKIHIAKDFVVSDAAIEGSRADLYVEYIDLGDLDPSLRYTNDFPGGSIEVRVGYMLVFGNKYWKSEDGEEDAKEVTGATKWRIDDSHPDQWITVETAIRFLTDTVDRATDEVIRKNAMSSLTALKRLRK
jgi:hypothetical protein